MPMIDTFKYEEFYYVHAENESPESGDEYSDEDAAIAAALENAKQGYGDAYSVTHVLTRLIGSVTFKFERE